MKILGIDHLGIATESIDRAAPFWSAILGLPVAGRETIAEQKVTTAFLPVGESELELLEATDPESAVAKFIARRGAGLQHLALRVDNLDAALAELKAKGVRLIDEQPRRGAGGTRIAFLHPQSTNGVLLELTERP